LACVGSDGKPNFSDNKGHVFVASFIAEAMTGLFDEIDRNNRAGPDPTRLYRQWTSPGIRDWHV
jgi:hypothetical protein